jgi:hypothetical protein
LPAFAVAGISFSGLIYLTRRKKCPEWSVKKTLPSSTGEDTGKQALNANLLKKFQNEDGMSSELFGKVRSTDRD